MQNPLETIGNRIAGIDDQSQQFLQSIEVIVSGFFEFDFDLPIGKSGYQMIEGR